MKEAIVPSSDASSPSEQSVRPAPDKPSRTAPLGRVSMPPAPAPPSAIAAPNATARPTPRERYETASKLEANNPGKALAIYSELSGESGLWAANALFAAARLELEQGHHGRASTLLDQYVRRFPNGPNIEDARKLLERPD
jgi:hypothetical protein